MNEPVQVKLPLVILAGSDNPQSKYYKKDLLLEYAKVRYKSLIELNGQPMILYTIKAFIESEVVSRIIIVGLPEKLLQIPESLKRVSIEFLEIQGTHSEKIIGASKKILMENPEQKRALFIGGDVPTITSVAIRDFVKACGNMEADFYFSIINEKTMNAAYPNNRRTYAAMKEGKFCGGDLQLVNIEMAVQRKELIDRLIHNRKSVVRQAFFISPFSFVRFLFRRISVEEAEKIVSKIFKAEVKAVVSPHADLGFDVDKPSQLELLRKLIGEGKLNLGL